MADIPPSKFSRSAARTPGTDEHGQAALLLVESLIHGLVARSLISVQDAVEIVDVAVEIRAAIEGDADDRPDTPTSLGMLEMIRLSLQSDF